MTKPEALQFSQYYHIYNRGNNGETLFREDRNYPYFLELYGRYIELVAETYAYCLMSNHFHLLVRIKSFGECEQVCQSLKDWQTYSHVYPSRAFANLFSTYTKAFNKSYQRTGSLFEKPFRRKLVDSDRYFAALVAYIHRNPQKHGFVADFRAWPHTSYRAILSDKPTRLQRDAVLGWFSGKHGFEEFHLVEVDESAIGPLIIGDWV
jgi:REP element-mobilizing transposase RayT